MNGQWWELRRELQGIDAPVERTEQDFDAGAKYHIPANVPYVRYSIVSYSFLFIAGFFCRYFVSFVVQFQFYEALCEDAGQVTEDSPLFLCDFSQGGEQTGKLIRNLMSVGFSQNWTQALEDMTGSPDMSSSSFIKYFLPLYEFLVKENQKNGECIGWASKQTAQYYNILCGTLEFACTTI